MTEARDHTKPKSEYKGRFTSCVDYLCPCRPCWNPHDWRREVRVYNEQGVHVETKYEVDMQCATRGNHGCPDPKPEPEHIFGERGGTLCKRCRAVYKPTKEDLKHVQHGPITMP